MHFFYRLQNELITFLSTNHSQSVENFYYLEHLQICGPLYLGKKYTYHQHKDKNHFQIRIEEGH